MTDAQILYVWARFINEPNERYPLTDADKIGFARAVLARSPRELPGVPAGLIAALRNQRQIDNDGSEVAVSRQAVDEAADFLDSLTGSAQTSTPDRDLVAIKECLLHEEPDLALALEVIHNSMARNAERRDDSLSAIGDLILALDRWNAAPFGPASVAAMDHLILMAAKFSGGKDAARYRWATSHDENSETLNSIVIIYSGNQEEIDRRVDAYRD